MGQPGRQAGERRSRLDRKALTDLRAIPRQGTCELAGHEPGKLHEAGPARTASTDSVFFSFFFYLLWCFSGTGKVQQIL